MTAWPPPAPSHAYPLGRRIGAYCMDYFFLTVFALPLAPFSGLSGIRLVTALLPGLVRAACHVSLGATPGKAIADLEVADRRNGRRLSVRMALLRELPMLLAGLVLLVAVPWRSLLLLPAAAMMSADVILAASSVDAR